ncbi:MAG: dihydroneopterin aldolase [Paracoccaceae bacterium]|jgi:dihydroneopterin aldolase
MTAEPLKELPKELPDTNALAAARPTRRVFISDLVLECLIGVYRHERDGAQRVRINLDLTVFETPAPIDDKLSNVLSYEDIIIKVRKLATAGHLNLVETLAERIAELCLAEANVSVAKVRVEKLDVFADAASVGVEIERSN